MQAYCLYRQNRRDEALSALSSVKSVNVEKLEVAQHLEAQLLYRLGRFQEAFQLFQVITKLAFL